MRRGNFFQLLLGSLLSLALTGQALAFGAHQVSHLVESARFEQAESRYQADIPELGLASSDCGVCLIQQGSVSALPLRVATPSLDHDRGTPVAQAIADLLHTTQTETFSARAPPA